MELLAATLPPPTPIYNTLSFGDTTQIISQGDGLQEACSSFVSVSYSEGSPYIAVVLEHFSLGPPSENENLTGTPPLECI